MTDGDERMRARAAAIEAFLAGRPDDGGRVTLRPLTRADRDAFIGLAAASRARHHPWMTLPDTPAAFDAYAARYTGPEEEQSLLVCLRGTGAITGMININSVIRGRFQNASLGYAAFVPGHGYMSEGLGLVIAYAFGQLRLHRLEAQIQAGNHASTRLVRRHGFRHEGTSPGLLYVNGAWRDHERWALLNTAGDPHTTLPVERAMITSDE